MTQKGGEVRIIYSDMFYTFYKKVPVYINNDFDYKLSIFLRDPFDFRLHTHKLSYELNNYYSFYLIHGYRVVFRFTNQNEAMFLAIGPHSIYSDVIGRLFGNIE